MLKWLKDKTTKKDKNNLSSSDNNNDDKLENNDNIVFMKVSRNFENLKQALIKTGNIDKIIMVSNCGKESQKVYYDIKDLTEDDIPYFTTLIVKKGGFEKWKKFTL